MLNGAQRNKIEEIRSAVTAMVAQRAQVGIEDVFQPSAFWRFLDGYLSYIRTLPVEHLENIRAHVGMGYFVGPSWHEEFYAGFRVKTDTDAEQHPFVKKYISYTAGLPERFWSSEPSTNDATAAIGIPFRGRRISADVVKEQATIRNLWNLGLVGDSDAFVLDIGPGYGQLVYQLSHMLGARSCFACVDFPEMLFWSGVFLAVNTDPAGIYVWRPGDTIPLGDLRKDYRFLLIPNSALAALDDGVGLELAINKNSFQEMTEGQVCAYSALLSKTLKGWVYSYNASRQFMNRELRRPVHTILAEFFAGGPTDEEYARAGVTFTHDDAKRIFVGSSRLGPVPKRTGRSTELWLADKSVRVDALSCVGDD